jgi:hypothetical protein
MAKVALVIWLAYSLAKKAERVKTFTVGFLPHLIVAGFFMLLCMKQPDFGSAVVLLFLTFTMLFVAGAKIGYILGASILGGVLGAAAIRFREYRYERYLAWLHMDQHRQDLAYQPFQSVMSFGSGGPTGLGLGRGLQTLYLPEAHTDFVAAIIGEELGFLGVAALCGVLLAPGRTRGARRASRSRRLRRLSGVWALDDVRGPGLGEPVGRPCHLADQRFDASTRELWGFVAGRKLLRGRHSPQYFVAGSSPAGAPDRREGVARCGRRCSRGVRLNRRTVLIAGGGTGGHVFPAIAVAEAMQSLADVTVVFCGTARGLEHTAVPARGFRLERLHVVPIKGGGPVKAARGALVALRATAESFATVRAVRPSAVLSVGGYAAGPVSLAAALAGTPLALLEPNSVAGMSNRLLGPLARRAYLAWGPAAGFRRSPCVGTECPCVQASRPGPTCPAANPFCWSSAAAKARRGSTSACQPPCLESSGRTP